MVRNYGRYCNNKFHLFNKYKYKTFNLSNYLKDMFLMNICGISKCVYISFTYICEI